MRGTTLVASKFFKATHERVTAQPASVKKMLPRVFPRLLCRTKP